MDYNGIATVHLSRSDQWKIFCLGDLVHLCVLVWGVALYTLVGLALLRVSLSLTSLRCNVNSFFSCGCMFHVDPDCVGFHRDAINRMCKDHILVVVVVQLPVGSVNMLAVHERFVRVSYV